jgi:amino acid adenylation domain-containing protein
LLDASFSTMPSQPAAEFFGTVLSRSELADRSDRLASWLIENGAGHGALVGIYMERSIEILVSVLGVLKAGAAYVALDPTFPRLRNEQILHETKVPVLLTLTRHRKDLHVSDARIFCVDGEAGALRTLSLQPLPKIHSEMRAYVIFTSGSSGVPKGVEVAHGSVVNMLNSARELLEIGPQDRLFAITTLAFDISVLELLLPLVSGGTVIIGSKEAAADSNLLMDQLAASRATVLQATPVTFRMLLDCGFQPTPGFKILCGGEAWTTAMAERLLASGVRLWNMYGPTETTVWSSITEIKRGDPRVVIGPPIANTRFYVVNERLQPVPAGTHGELLIAGAGVALGYFQRDLLTTEKFLPDPNVPGERMYQTGDLVRRLADGRIEFLGRLDQQIKLRGHRIELGEIESIMTTCAGVSAAVAVLREEADGEAFLIGFYTATIDVAPLLLRETLVKELPAYMIPRYFTRLDAFPLTPNGKTDRRSLAAREWTEVVPELAAAQETQSATELVMVPIWEKLFPGETIDADSDYFELGGDSLLLIQLQAIIRSKFDLRLEAIDISNHFTVRKLSRWVDEGLAGGRPMESPDRDPRVLPLHNGGEGQPIFILPQMMYFRVLAELLGSEQPVYAIQILEDDLPQEISSPSMEDLARLYVRFIRKMQPSGPYRLAGWCLWGWMAYEVARLLEEQGQTIELLAIFDAVAPGFWEQFSEPRKFLIKMNLLTRRLGGFLVRLRRIGFADKGKERLRLLRTFAVSIAFALPRRFRPEGYVIEVPRLDQIANQAARSYNPSPIRAKVLLFACEMQPTSFLMGRDMGWGSVLGHPVQVNLLPGNHNEIFHPLGASVIAMHVRNALGLKSHTIAQT